MNKIIKNVTLFSVITIGTLFLTSTSSFALCYSSKTTGDEIHQRSCSDTFQAAGLLSIYFTDGSFMQGTATLIAPDVVITAAHYLTGPGKQIKSVSFQPQCNGEGGIAQSPKNVWFHPDYDGSAMNNNDIALVQLAQPYHPHHIRPAQLQKTIPTDFVSAPTTVVGYGLSGNNHEGPIHKDNKRRAGNMELSLHFFHKNLLTMPFTSNQNGAGFIDSSDGSKYATIIAAGDSGGPAFIQLNGEPSARIIGIVMGAGTYGGINKVAEFVSIPYCYPWIESILALCGHSIGEQSTTLDYKKSEAIVFEYIKEEFESRESKTDEQFDDIRKIFETFKPTDDSPSSSPDNVDNQDEKAWNTIKDYISSASGQGSEALQSLYDYASSIEYKKNMEDILASASSKLELGELEGLQSVYDYISSIEYRQNLEGYLSTASDTASQVFDEYIKAHKELFE